MIEDVSTVRSRAADRYIHTVFEKRAAQHPDALAVVSGIDSLTFSELNAKANRLARHLADSGVRAETCVGMCIERGTEAVVGMLAVLKAGGVYVPLDPRYPSERLRSMLADAKPAIVLVKGETAAVVAAVTDRAVLCVDLSAQATEWQRQLDTNLAADAQRGGEKRLAYVIFTSGSTGRPKGVGVEHASLCNLVAAQIAFLDVSPGSRVLQVSSFNFDAHIFEMFMALCSGATLHFAAPHDILVGETLANLIDRSAITHATITPSVLETIPPQRTLPSLRTLVVAGEALSGATARRWATGRRTINAYGPTEATVCATWFDCIAEGSENPPIGHPLPHVSVYVLDENGRTSPVGEVGEIFVAGAGVARGYLDRPVETAERFVPDPFSADPGARMFKTGDIGRFALDGNLEFVGRNDDQLKVRGIRIEPGDIESHALRHEAVRQARVVLRETGPGQRQLFLYYTTRDRVALAPNSLRDSMRRALPEAMLPDVLVELDTLPLTPNGKLDVRALPVPQEKSGAVGHEDPMGDLERKVASLWREVLRVERVGRRDHFFRLGGQSLLAAMVIARVRQTLGFEARLQDLFDRPVLLDFVVGLARATTLTRSEIATQPERALSFAQKRLWFVSQMERGSKAYHISLGPTGWVKPGGLRLRGPLDRAALRRALDHLVERHESLRTTFVNRHGEPLLRIAEANTTFSLKEEDLRGRAGAHSDLERLKQQEIAAEFDLERGPLIRACLVQLHDVEHVLLITMHHIVSDGTSTELMLRELAVLYSQYRNGAVAALPPLTLQYADYAVWQQRHLTGAVLEEQTDYWRRTLAGVAHSLALPTDRPRPAQQDFSGSFVDVALDVELTRRLKELSLEHNVTMYMTLLAGWAIVMSRLAQQEDVVIGTPFAGRTRPEFEPLVGFFVNTLALRIELAGAPRVCDLLERVRERVVGAHQNQELPFERVVELVNPPRDRSRTPLFQVMFAWQNHVGGDVELSDLAISAEPLPYDTAKFDLLLNLGEADGQVVGGIEYATSLFDRQTVERYIGYFRAVLRAMVADDRRSVVKLPLLSDEERRELVIAPRDVASAEAAGHRFDCAHLFFEAQVAKTPQATAVIHDGRRISYADLDRRAGRIAARLRHLGVGPDARVAICVERSIEMIVGVLGILEAGGAYVPLDPTYPPERLAYMLTDSRAQILLVHAQTPRVVLERLHESSPEVAVVALDADGSDGEEPTAPATASAGVGPHNLAYVIYTSGSTGKPKAVAMTHGPLCNLIAWQTAGGEPLPTLQFAPLSFDVSFQEIFTTLCSGAPLVLIDSRVRQDPARLFEVVRRHEIGRLFLPYVALSMIADWAATVDTLGCALREIIVAGEQLRITPAVARLLARLARCQLHNHYGPTEAHVVTAFSAPEPARWPELPPIGRPIPRARIYLLDPYGEPVPHGVVGELYIGGDVLARGYLQQPALTAERFVPDPFGSPGSRMYRTGDLARYRAGAIEFIGRNDSQVKIRGFRIEVGEIEARLGEHPAVRDAVVVARNDAAGRPRLVAYYAAKDEIGDDSLRQHLAVQLPEYMVPAAFVRLAALPLTPSGKVDRNTLPDAPVATTSEDELPEGQTESRLAAVWADILGLERVARRAHFFDSGGHSLLATVLLLRVRSEFGVDLALEDLFNAPVLVDFARAVVKKQLAAYSIT
jgi:amino acid adenylation domain-containing protein